MDARSRILKGGLSALLCLCMVMGNFGGVATALAANEMVPPVEKNASNDSAKFEGVSVDQVTLLTGEKNDLRGADVKETVKNYEDRFAIGIAADFCVFLKDYFTPMESDAEGRVAVGGNMNINTPFGWINNENGPATWNYTIGAGDYNTHVPLDVLLGDRTGAATVILQGKLGSTMPDGKYTQTVNNELKTLRFKDSNATLNDTYYEYVEEKGKYYKFEYADENNGIRKPQHISSKRLVINQSSVSNANAYLSAIDTQNYGDSYWKMIKQQAYVTKLLDFDEAFSYLYGVSQKMVTQASVTQRSDDTDIDYDESSATLTMTYNGAAKNQECIFFNLSAEQFEKYFRQAKHIHFKNVPLLSEPRKVVDNYGEKQDWKYSYIIVNVAGSGMLRFNPENKQKESKITVLYTADGEILHISNEGNEIDNNHMGVTSILYNFYEADANTTLVLCSNFQGTVFAPKANVIDEFKLIIDERLAEEAPKTNGLTKSELLQQTGFSGYRGHLSGALVANSFEGGTEFGYRPFSALRYEVFAEGNIAISKEVRGEGADPNQVFDFTLSLKNAENEKIADYSYDMDVTDSKTGELIPGAPTSVQFSNGSAKIQLKDGQTATIRDLPAYIKYKVSSYVVTEDEVPGYTATVTGDTGEMPWGKVVNVRFVNTFNAVDNAPKTGDTFSPALWLGLMAISLMGIGISSRAMRREKARR